MIQYISSIDDIFFLMITISLPTGYGSIGGTLNYD